jgi:hypothetical protein
VGTPIAIGRLIQVTRRPISVAMLANQGTVGVVDDQGRSQALFAGNIALPINEGATARTSTTDTGIMSLTTPDGSLTLGRVQIYANSNMTLARADTPRFQRSSRAHEAAIDLESGRIRITLLPQPERPIHLLVTTPHAIVEIEEPGDYSIELTPAQLLVSVHEGRAFVEAEGERLAVLASQRAQVMSGGTPQGPLATQRNLITNGEFSRGLENWATLDWIIELPEEPSGDLLIVEEGGDAILKMRREGIGHADAGVRQLIDQDIRDFQSLVFSVNLRVNHQSLGVCGNRGSECPLIVRIEYEDVFGARGEWFQGFYAEGNTGSDLPDVCVSCAPPRNPHIQFTPGQLRFYESDNIMARLEQQDIQLSLIRNISLIASGHAFDIDVVSVSLTAQE